MRYDTIEYRNRVIRVYEDGKVEVWSRNNKQWLALVVSVKAAMAVIDAMYENN